MHTNRLKFIQDIQRSYWFVPGCMVIAAFLLTFVTYWIDSVVSIEGTFRGLRWLTANSTEGARAVLTVIAGSIIGVAGVTFSITIVAVSFASANYGPRLIGNFMRDRGNQITLGTFISAFVYSLMTLRTVQSASDGQNDYDAFVPHFSILVALGLALASIGVLIYFIHHVPETINVSNIAARIGRGLRREVSDLFPGAEALDACSPAGECDWDAEIKKRRRVAIPTEHCGYVQAIDVKRLAKAARGADFLARVQSQPGDFVIEKSTLVEAWPREPLSDRLIDEVRQCYAIGAQRTAHQNVLFLASQLVEIIARALSPGVNDPFTAITCLNWLKVGLANFTDHEHKEGRRVQIAAVDFERFASSIFDHTIQYVCADRNTSIHAMDVLSEIINLSEDGRRKKVLFSHLRRLSEASAAVLLADAGGRDVQRQAQRALSRDIAASVKDISEPRLDQHFR